MAERHVQIAKKLLTKAKLSRQDPYIAILEMLSTPIDGFASPAQLISGRRYRSILPINPQLLRVKPVNSETFLERRQHIQEKQVKYYNQHTKPLKVLHEEEKIRMLHGSKWKPASVLYHSSEPRSYFVKNEDGDVYRWNRRQLLKTGDGIVELSDDDMDENQGKSTQVQKGFNGDAKQKIENEEEEIESRQEGDVTENKEEASRWTYTRYGRLSRKPLKYKDYVT